MTKTDKPQYHTHISSKHKLLSLNLKEVWRYRDLIALFTKRSFVLTYKQTILGPLWLILNPLMSSFIHAFVFGGIADIGTDGVPSILFYFTSNALWAFFSSCVTSNASTFTANSAVFGKVYFPRLTTPISNVLSALGKFLIQMVLTMAFLVFYLIRGNVAPNWHCWILIPIELIHLGILGMGIGIIISSLTTKYRDLSVLVGFGVSLWMYITPIVYPMSEIEGGLMKELLMVNPVTPPIEIIRYALLGKGTIDVPFLIISWVIAIVVMVFGIMVFNKVERTFMDTV